MKQITFIPSWDSESQLSLKTYHLLKQATNIFIFTAIPKVLLFCTQHQIPTQTFTTHQSFIQAINQNPDTLTTCIIPPNKLEDVVQILKDTEITLDISEVLQPYFQTLQNKASVEYISANTFLNCTAPFHGYVIIEFQNKQQLLHIHTHISENYSELSHGLLINAQMLKKVTFELPFIYTNNLQKCNYLIVYYERIQNIQIFAELIETIAKLRGEHGCPWDRKQTHQSLKPYLIEETYEVTDAITENNPKHLAEELGDVLLQVMLHAQIGAEEKTFDIYDIIQILNEKMIRRHPHVFSKNGIKLEYSSTSWDKIKKQEHSYLSISEAMQQLPQTFPALIYAQKVQKKAASCGMDFQNIHQACRKVMEELDEFQLAVAEGNQSQMEEEAGDLLFAALNPIRLSGINGEEALRNAVFKFIKRFSKVETFLQEDNTDFDSLSTEELNRYWNRAKNDTK